MVRAQSRVWWALGVLLAGGVGWAQAQPVQWAENGHWYEAVAVGSGGITWTDAQQAAVARGGYLASITSEAENQFVYSLIGGPSFWHSSGGGSSIGPWIGGWQLAGSLEPAGGWQWTSGEPFVYNNWGPNQPTNTNGKESYIHFYGPSNTPSPQWNDLPDTPPANWYVKGYVVESVPEPLSLSWLALAGMLLLRARRRAGRIAWAA